MLTLSVLGTLLLSLSPALSYLPPALPRAFSRSPALSVELRGPGGEGTSLTPTEIREATEKNKVPPPALQSPQVRRRP
jgi:hypothetical protein